MAYTEQQKKHKKGKKEYVCLPSTKRHRLTPEHEQVETLASSLSDADVKHLPEAVPEGNFKAVPKATFIAFDLETTGLVRGGKYPHIMQIAASVIGSAKKFSAYVYPKLPISYNAQKITGISIDNSGTLTLHGQPVNAEKLYISIENFCKWLQKHSNVYLIAHNGKKFDFPVLMSALMNINYDAQFMECVLGFIDSMEVFKKAFPAQSSYRQEDLARALLDTTYEAHNAMEDVKILGKLILHTEMNTNELTAYSFQPTAVQGQN